MECIFVSFLQSQISNIISVFILQVCTSCYMILLRHDTSGFQVRNIYMYNVSYEKLALAVALPSSSLLIIMHFVPEQRIIKYEVQQTADWCNRLQANALRVRVPVARPVHKVNVLSLFS